MKKCSKFSNSFVFLILNFKKWNFNIKYQNENEKYVI